MCTVPRSSPDAHAQKKKNPAKATAKTVSTVFKKGILAKSGDVSAEQLEKKSGILFYAMSGKDTLFSKSLAKEAGIPADVKIASFTAFCPSRSTEN